MKRRRWKMFALAAKDYLPARSSRRCWQAIILANAGLERLALNSDAGRIEFEGRQFFTALLPPEFFVPAGGQAIIAVQVRSEDERLKEMVHAINDFDTRLALRAEREFL